MSVYTKKNQCRKINQTLSLCKVDRLKENVCLLICEALGQHEQRTLGRLIEESCKNIFLALFEEAHQRVKGNIYITVSEVMDQAVVKGFFTEEPDKLLDDKIYKLAKTQESTQGLVLYLIKRRPSQLR